MSGSLARIATHLLLAAVAAFALLPLVWMVLASLSPLGSAGANAGLAALTAPTLENYQALYTRLDIGRHVLNSALLATVITAVSLLINSLAGYAFAKLHFPGRDRTFALLLAALVVPGQVAMLPLFLLLKELGLINTYLGVIVPGMASIFGIFLVRQYALGLPDSVLDAARVDGASELRIYWSIVLPMCRPILVTLGLFTFMGSWNDFMWPLIVLNDEKLHTLPVALANLAGEYVQDTELMMAGAVLTIAPVVVLFLALQRYYIEGIMAGSVKT